MTAVTIIILKIEWLFPWLLFLLNAVKIYTFLTNARLEFKWGGWNGGGASSVFCDIDSEGVVDSERGWGEPNGVAICLLKNNLI